MEQLFTEIASLGAAGIMGAMWLIERRFSTKRDAQLTKTHDKLIESKQNINYLTSVIQKNTAAFTKLNETQNFQTEIIKQLIEELHHAN